MLPGDLSHVFWIGGSACAGKSSVARILAERWGAALYSLDDEFPRHRERASPDLHPGFSALMDRPAEKLWEGPPVSLAEELLAFHRDQLVLAREDLAALPGQVVAEGVGVLPESLPRQARAVFLVAGEDWRRDRYPRRGELVGALLARCSDPQGAFERWMERDDLVSRHVAREARRRGFPCLAVEGGGSLDETADRAAALLLSGEDCRPSDGDARRRQG